MHKSHFAMKFTGKMPETNPGDIVLCEPAQSKMHMDILQEPFCVENLMESAGRFQYHLNQTPGLNCYCNSVATVFGEKRPGNLEESVHRGNPNIQNQIHPFHRRNLVSSAVWIVSSLENSLTAMDSHWSMGAPCLPIDVGDRQEPSVIEGT